MKSILPVFFPHPINSQSGKEKKRPYVLIWFAKKKVTTLQMHRMHCGSNKVRRGSWPPQVSFVSRLLPPTEWPWPWATRPTAVWWAWWTAPGWRAPARRARRGAVIPMRLANCWEVQLRAERLCRTSRSIQLQQLEAWRARPVLGLAGGRRVGAPVQ